MNKIILLLLSAIILISACGQNTPGNSITNINSIEFQKMISSGKGVLLDVRTENEFKSGHIANAGQLNFYAPDFRERLLLLPKDQPIYLYCLTGSRSKAAAQFLAQNGYSKIFNLQRGIMEWNQNNLPVVSDPKAIVDNENLWEPAQFNELIKTDKLVFIDFYAPWCSPCIKMMPMIDAMKLGYKDKIDIVKVNADVSKNLVKELKLPGVPFLALYYKGEMIYSKNGSVAKEELQTVFQEKINKYRVSE